MNGKFVEWNIARSGVRRGSIVVARRERSGYCIPDLLEYKLTVCFAMPMTLENAMNILFIGI